MTHYDDFDTSNADANFYATMSAEEIRSMDEALGTGTTFISKERNHKGLPEVTVIPEYRFGAKTMAQLVSEVASMFQKIIRSDQSKIIAAKKMEQHEQKILAKRNGTAFEPTPLPHFSLVTLDKLEHPEYKQDVQRALLTVLRKSHTAGFTMLTSQFVHITLLIRDAKQNVRSAQDEHASPELQLMLPAFETAVLYARAEFSGLRQSMVETDAMEIAKHIDPSLKISFKAIHAVRNAMYDVIIDSADDQINERDSKKFIPKNVLTGREDRLISVFNDADPLGFIEEGVMKKLDRSFNATPNYAAESRATRLDQSVYRDTNEVVILSETTEVLVRDLLAKIGVFFPETFNTVFHHNHNVTPALHAIGEVEGMLGLLEDERNWDEVELTVTDDGYQERDAALVMERYEAISCVQKELDYFTQPRLYGNTYVLGNGGNRTTYTATLPES